ncbi:MAG TPA: CHRD domain-containing protein [Blastocatellia bacterium]|nr:CHRD domain-containing protein [Blastocatellia bacterium]
MKHSRIVALVTTTTLLVMLAALALAVPDGVRNGDPDKDKHKDKSRSLRARLKGVEENPVILTGARGEFKATISSDDSSIEYELSYQNLEGAVTQGHIHIAQKGVNGGISVWLCGTPAAPGPAGTPTCGATGASGTITAATVIGPAGQGVAVGEFDELVRAIRRGLTYANVHSTLAPGGEIRGQIRVRGDDDDD